MPTPTPAQKFLSKHTALTNFVALEGMIKAIPFAELRSLLQEAGCELPDYFFIVQKKLSEVEGAVDKGQRYKVKLGSESKELALGEYKELLHQSISLYQLEGYFKEKLRVEMDALFISLNNNADVIASHKGMDDGWVKSALRNIRSADRQERKKLRGLLDALTSYRHEHGLVGG